MLDDILRYLGEAADKPGRAVRGLLAGRPEEGFATLPFSDSMGLTDQKNAVGGDQLLHEYLGLDPNSTAGQIGGFVANLATDPLSYLGVGMAGRVGALGKLAKEAAPIALTRAPSAASDFAQLVKAPGEVASQVTKTPGLFDALLNPKSGGVGELLPLRREVTRLDDVNAHIGQKLYKTGKWDEEWLPTRTVESSTGPSYQVGGHFEESGRQHATRPGDLATSPSPTEIKNDMGGSPGYLPDRYVQTGYTGASPGENVTARMTGGYEAADTPRMAQIRDSIKMMRAYEDETQGALKGAYDPVHRTVWAPNQLDEVHMPPQERARRMLHALSSGGPADTTEVTRHEMVHALANRAAASGDLSALPYPLRMTTKLQGSSFAPAEALGFLGEEGIARHVGGSESVLQFLLSGHPSYAQKAEGISPMVADFFRAGPALLPAAATTAGAAGTAALLAALADRSR